MNIDTLLVDLEIIGQIKEDDKLAVSNVVGSTKLFVNQYSLINSIYRRYNGFNRIDSIVYLENLITRIESACSKIIDGNFTDMALSLKTSIEKSIIGLEKLKITYDNDSEIVARLIICTNKLSKVFENLKDYNDTLDDMLPCFNDINIDNSSINNEKNSNQ